MREVSDRVRRVQSRTGTVFLPRPQHHSDDAVQVRHWCKYSPFHSDYNDNLYINALTFPGTLFTVNGQPANYQCGDYSMVGLAQRGEIVTRIIATMPPHFLVSLTFNVFAVDQPSGTEPTVFVIILDDIVLEASYLNLEGMSNLCGAASLESFVTYPATRFYPHTSETDVNLTISGNSSNWAVRNVRFAYKICD